MAAPRRFDHDLCRDLYTNGQTIRALSDRFGVSVTAIRLALDEDFRRHQYEYAVRYAMSASCVDCGGPCAKYATGVGIRPNPRCRRCASFVRATSVRSRELRCVTCREWKADDDFPFNRAESGARRGRHGVCRACQTALRRAYREARKVRCSHGCGKLVLHERRDPNKPPECRTCAMRRIHAGRKAAVAA